MTEGTRNSESQPCGVLPSERRHERADSDRVNPRDVLKQLRLLEMCVWQKSAGGEDRVEHLGPSAEEFFEVFTISADPDRIVAGDTDGVAMAAIQGVADRLDAEDIRIDRHERQIQRQQEIIEEQRADLELLRERLESLQTEVARLRLAVADRD